MSSIVYDIDQLYQRTFGGRPAVPKDLPPLPPATPPYALQGAPVRRNTDMVGNTLRSTYMGVEVWLPTAFTDLPADLFERGVFELPFSVIRVTGSTTIVRTPLADRRGSVKELYSIDDYRFEIKGFFIDLKERLWPYQDLLSLKKLHELGDAFSIDNALANIFLEQNDKVVMNSFQLPEVEGGRKHVRPFIIQLESDSVNELTSV
jgi:hypothetical protein